MVKLPRSELQQLKLLPLHNWRKRVQLAMIAISRGGPLLRYVIIVISDLQLPFPSSEGCMLTAVLRAVALRWEPRDVVPTTLRAAQVVLLFSSRGPAASLQQPSPPLAVLRDQLS